MQRWPTETDRKSPSDGSPPPSPRPAAAAAAAALLRQSVVPGATATQVGFNWGLKSSHPLPADKVVQLLRDNGVTKVKLFEADPQALTALAKSGIEVMVGIQNDLLDLSPAASPPPSTGSLRTSPPTSPSSAFVAVGNEPFLETYKDKYLLVTFPALQNVQAALIKAGLGRQVKVTVPLNADVYQSVSGLPSGGDFRDDIRPLMVSIARFLLDNGSPLAINIYPFLSLYADPHFPVEYAFFDGGAAPVVDGAVSYTNVFEANYDTLIWALEKNGLSSLTVIVGEIGWPTDGDANANLVNARRFNQGLLNRVMAGKGTPKRPSAPPEMYLFGLLDEDTKNIDPGAFERHWGVFYYDGGLKYPLALDGGGASSQPGGCGTFPGGGACSRRRPASTIPDRRQWVLLQRAGPPQQGLLRLQPVFQAASQQSGSCGFSNLSVITTTDPSQGSCRFGIMIDTSRRVATRSPSSSSSSFLSHGFRRWGAQPAVVVAAAALSSLLL
ncbi:unnamed protein product [Spirodela intermedia]|uniref:Uncharacterized protein n=1 Tax=Spirodela intermedia TaxID=51605 RepID=A0A7I8J381_SPIIN|nr:unnamed protein product [Spirodela intermedia]CAA6664568.1 unnamed protein product [Spirodela intermedia]